MLRSINLSRSKFFSHAGLSDLAINCKNLAEIDLSNGTELKDLAAASIAEAKNLERLWLVRCKSITDIGIGCIAVGCRKLKLLNLRWCLGVGDLGVGLVAIKCKEIRSLDLSFLPITNKCLAQILELQYLEDLALEGCHGIDDEGLAALRKGCNSLQNLDISSCQSVSHVGLSSLTSVVGYLKQLSLSYGPQVDLAVADSLQKLSTLHSLKLDGCRVTSQGVKVIGRFCVSLRELSLSKCIGVEDEGIYSLVSKRKDLKKLDITCCREITQKSLAHITNSCAGLVSLKMESCGLILAQAFVSIGQHCHLLEELDLTDTEVDDEGLKSISKSCSHLESLKLGLCLNISDMGLIHIGMNCAKLKEIDLYRSLGITDLSVSALARGCPGLETISLAYCESITDLSLTSLSKCPKLKVFEIRGCSWVTSSGLAALASACRQLCKLDIKKCRSIDDLGMTALAQFSVSLKQISLSYTSVSDKGLLSLSSISCLQSMTVLHTEGLSWHGLGAALLACRGLTKAKLHASFKSSLPTHLLRHLQDRGCVFQWRDKVFQPELDPRCWKQHISGAAYKIIWFHCTSQVFI